MLFSTLNQGQVFLTFLYFGIVLGVVAKLCDIILKKLKPSKSLQDEIIKQKIPKKKQIKTVLYHSFLSFFVVVATFVFGVLCYFYNFGQIRFFCLFGYCFGMFLTFVLWKFVKAVILKHKIKKLLKQN